MKKCGRKKSLFLILLLMWCVITFSSLLYYEDDEVMAQMEHVFYVSPKGDDSNPGTKDSPFKSLQKAKNAVRELKEQSGIPEGGIKVVLRDGIYPIEDTIKFTSADSGSEGKYISYEAYPGEKPILFGGKILKKTDFKKVEDNMILDRVLSDEAKEKLLQVDLKSLGINDYGEIGQRGYSYHNSNTLPQVELFVEDERMILARYPNEGRIVYTDVLEPNLIMGKDTPREGGATLKYPEDIENPKYWSDFSDIWVDGIFSRDWTWNYNKVESIDPQNYKLKLKYRDTNEVNTWLDARGFHFENVLEEIDIPGEYYIDRNNGVLYYLPTEEFTKNEDPFICLSMLDKPMFRLEGATYIRIKGITFNTSRSTAIEASGIGTYNFVFEDNEVKNFALHALWLKGNNISIKNNYIHHIGGCGIYIDGGDVMELTPSNNVIENNHIHNIAYLHKVYNPAIKIFGVGNIVKNNLIHHTPHMAISIKGNDHIIEYNEFHSSPLEFRDMGIIYLNTGGTPYCRGTIIRYNYFHDYETPIGDKSNWGVYPDNGTQGVIIEKNIFYNSSTSGGVFVHGGGYNEVRYNLFIDVKQPILFSNYFVRDWARSIVKSLVNNWADQRNTYNFSTMPHNKYPGLVEFYNFDDQLVQDLTDDDYSNDSQHYTKPQISQPMNSFEFNVIYNSKVEREYPEGIHTDFGDGISNDFNIQNNLVFDQDPGFRDYENEDFTINEDSEIYEHIPDFPDIPFEEIGLRKTGEDLDITTDGLVLWLDADDKASVIIDESSRKVNKWISKSGQYEALPDIFDWRDSRPEYKYEEINGRNVIRFNGSHYLTINGINRDTVGDVTVFVVSQRISEQSSDDKWQRILSCWDGSDIPDNEQPNFCLVGTKPGENDGNGAEYELDIFYHHYTDVKISSLGIGVNLMYKNHQFLKGDIAEILIYDRQLKDEEIENVNNYLENKWGIR